MPKLPDPGEFQRVAPNPNRGVADYRPTIDSEANTRLGDQIKQIADVETKRLDDLKAADAETELMRKELELGEQYKGVKGGDVLKPDFHTGFKQRYGDAVSAIQGTLSTPAQKARFAELAKRRSVGFDANRITYAMGEAETFEKVQHQSRLQVLTDTATAQYANPNVIASTALQLEDEIVKWGVKQGMGKDIATAYTKEAKGNFYSSIIAKAIIDNDTSTANSMYAAAKPFLSNEQSAHISSQLKVGNDYQEGQKLAVEAQKMVTEGRSMAEVELFVATATTPGAYTAAQTIFTNLQQAHDRAQKEAAGSVFRIYHEAQGSNAAKRNVVLNSPEFKALSDTQRADVYKYFEDDQDHDDAQYRAKVQFGFSVENQNYTRGERADAKVEKAREKKFRTDEVMAKFNTEFNNLKKTSVTELYSKVPELGIANVEKLITAKKNIEAGGDTKPLQMDTDLINAAIPAEWKTNKKMAYKADSFKGFVQESLMGWQERNPGKKPTLEEQKTILRAANSEYFTDRGNFGTVDREDIYTTDVDSPDSAGVKRGIIKDAAARGVSYTAEEVEYKYHESIMKRDIVKAATAKGKTLTPAQVDNIYRKKMQQKQK